MNSQILGVSDGNDDYEIEDYSSSDNDEDNNDENEYNDDYKANDKQRKMDKVIGHDFQHVKTRLFAMQFNAKKDLPMMVKPFQFKKFGFNNKQDCKWLCKQAKSLVKRHPRQSNKSKKRHLNNKNDNNLAGLEGFVEDTN